MKSFRFLHAADLHLDTPFSGMSGVPDRLRAYLRGSTFAAFDRLIRLAIAEAVDFIVLAGDIYDAADSSLRAQLRLREGWDKLERHGIPVYLIRGNHDPLGSRRLRLELPPHVTEFGAQAESRVAVRRSDGEPVAVVSGISYITPAVTENLALRFRRDEAEANSPLYHIALLHANVDGQEGHDAYAPCSLRELKEAGYDYWALGHIHKRQILSEKPWVVYPGNIQGRSLKETGPKGCYIVDVHENGQASLAFHRLDQVLWREITVPIDGLASEEAWKERVEEALEEVREAEPGRISIVRLTFTGRGPLHTLLQSGQEAAELLQELRRRESRVLEEEGLGIAPENAPFAAAGGSAKDASGRTAGDETGGAPGGGGARNHGIAATVAADGAVLAPLGGVVWPAGFKVETSLEMDRLGLLEEDSFLGELLRLGERAGREPGVLEDIAGAALAPLTENRTLRRLLKELEPQERLALLRRAEELAWALLAEEGTAGGRGVS
ncbi:DNA repair exonuclease [Paenibacillus macerans]|uniref:metallophosphoesterase family protein n=1 Tax=Paenibacillus macerans TaxID=44252 RepID=UPI00203E6847|nr:DNA repair exonuclease [Paenibacillus macerans]MCM3699815.1 DNA repair exonuclease [Paenibacillus macerans]